MFCFENKKQKFIARPGYLSLRRGRQRSSDCMSQTPKVQESAPAHASSSQIDNCELFRVLDTLCEIQCPNWSSQRNTPDAKSNYHQNTQKNSLIFDFGDSTRVEFYCKAISTNVRCHRPEKSMTVGAKPHWPQNLCPIFIDTKICVHPNHPSDP